MSNLNLNTISSLDTGREVDVNRVMQTVDYVGGLVIDSLDTVIVDGDDRYVLAASTALPYTTTGAGMPEGGAFVSVGDAKLRGDLVQPVATFDSVADMVNATGLTIGRKLRTLGYYTPGDGGGNDYEVVAAGTGTDDGGSYIDLSGGGLQARGLFSAGSVSITQFGVADGVPNSDGFISAFKYLSDGLIVPSGRFIYSGLNPITEFKTNNLEIYGIGGRAEISIQNDTYLFEHSEETSKISFIGVTFIGGKGAYRSTFTGTNNTGGSRTYIDRCSFLDYSVCSYSHNSADRPYQTILNSKFRGVSGGDTIGVSITGLTDGLNIERCDFLSNSYHIAIQSKSSSANISANNFFSNGGIVKKADIWVIPTNDPFVTASGPCLNINKNKFGSENQPVGEPKIIIANSQGLLSDSYRPDTTNSANTVYGLKANENRIAGPLTWGGSFIKCYITELIASQIHDNVVQSGVRNMKYILEYDEAPLNFRQSRNSIKGTKTGNGSFFSIPITNGIDRFDDDLFNWGDGFQPELKSETSIQMIYRNYNTANTGSGGAVVTAIPNPDFGVNSGALVSFNSSTDQWLSGSGSFPGASLIAQNTGNYLVLEFDARKSSTSPLDHIEVKVRDIVGEQDIFSQVMKVPEDYKRVQAVFKIPAISSSSPSYRIIINPVDHSASKNKFEIYNMALYISNSPANTKHIQAVGGDWDEPHLVLGGYHLWVDSTGKLRIKSGAPVSDTDGVIVGSQS